MPQGRFPLASETSTRIAQTGRDAVDGGGDGAVDLGRVLAGALAAQHVDLNQVHGIDVRIAELDGVRKDLVGFEQFLLFCDCEKSAHGAMKLCFKEIENA